ncbi:hypothetical protein Pmani_022996 [Petrolisthes manimaculis]|uniref:Uncharacterized protein n=1 Tax=Petrolisthes manimaculis TaxID=1843537 RepID=A0AAE1PCY4_9EUCA|nr:hypothetical protein Pmani_038096 [Petrolisthes manimaculis]KAK4305096.1 hypothetical protein Pmani_022996 [Petrolisthes manimaculis]
MLVDSTAAAYDWSYFLAWIGVGWTLISALLFSGASVCLRSEREREDAKSMAYLMPGTRGGWASQTAKGFPVYSQEHNDSLHLSLSPYRI